MEYLRLLALNREQEEHCEPTSQSTVVQPYSSLLHGFLFLFLFGIAVARM